MRISISVSGGLVGTAKRVRARRATALLAAAATAAGGLGAGGGRAAHAATYVFDPLASTAGGTDGSGSWDTTTSDWFNTSTGATVNPQPWSNSTADTAVFGSGGTAGTVAVSSVNVGTIQFNTVTGSYGLAGGTVTLGGAATITAGPGTTSSIASILTGAAGLTVNGGGTLALSGTNTFTGGFKLLGSTLDINSTAALGPTSGTFNIGSGSTVDNTTAAAITVANPVVQAGGYAYAGTRGLTFSGGYTLFNAGTGVQDAIAVNAGTLTLSGGIGGTGGLNKTGPGMLTLTAGSTYTGGLNVSGGTLSISTVSQLGAGGSANGGSAATASGTVYIGAAEIDDTNGTTGVPLSPGVNFVFGSPTSTFGITTAAANLTLNGTLSGSGSFNKNGPGQINFNTSSVTYAGATNVLAGTLSVGAGFANGTLGSTSGVTVSGGATLAFNVTGGLIVPTPIGGAGTVLLAAPLASATALNTFTLTGANTYTGPTNVSGGSMLVLSSFPNSGVPSVLGASSNASGNLLIVGTAGAQNTFNNGAGLIYTGTGDTTDRGISFGGTVQNTINVSNPSATLTIAGQTQVLATTGTFRFYKAGGGTLAFTNPGPNAFNTGAFFSIDGGTLQLGAPGQVNNVSQGLTVGNQLATPGAAPLLNVIGGTTNVAGPLSLSNGDPVAGQALTANLSGGVVNTTGVNLVINNSAVGLVTTLNLTNAAVLDSTGPIAGPTTNGSTGVINVSGTAQFNVSGTGSNLSPGAGAAAAGTINQSGGTVTIAGGLALVNSGTAPATGTYNLSGGTLNTPAISASSTNAASRSVLNLNGGTLQAAASTPVLVNGLTAANVLGGGGTIDTQAFNVTLPQALSHGGTAATDGGLTKVGTGTLTLSGNNAYTGNTQVQAGTLVVGGPAALGTGSAVLANGTTLALTVANLLSPATINTNGVYTPVVAGGTVTLTTPVGSEATSVFSSTPVSIPDAGGFTAGFTYTHGTTAADFGPADGITFTLQNAGPTALGSSGGALGYNGSTGGGTAITPSVAAVIDEYHDQIGLGQNGVLPTGVVNSAPGLSNTSSSVVTVVYNGAAQTLTETVVDAQGTYTSTLSNFDLAAQLNQAGSATASAYFGFTGGTGANVDTQSISNFTFSPLTASRINTASGVVVAPAAAATLQLAPTALYSSGAVGPITIGTGGTLAVSIGTTPAANVSHGVLTTPSVTFANATSGTLDLGPNALDVTGQSIASVTAQVATAYAAGTWRGPGITSSAAAADANRLTAVGVVLNNVGGLPLYGSGNPLGLFEGANPAAGDVLVKYTYYGDANLDGKVDGSDYALIDAGFLSGGTLTGWYDGDFNYDGVVDASDYTLIDNAFNLQGSPLSTSVLPGGSAVAAATDEIAPAASPTAVPEPAAVGLVAAGAVGLLARRRR